MKILRMFLCSALILFLLFSPATLVSHAQESFVDARFVRKEPEFNGTVVLYHIVRHRPYSGSLTQWLKDRAAEYEKKHKGLFIEIEGMDEAAFYERVENGRKPDAYSFFSGSLYEDRLADLACFDLPLREGLFITEKAAPYCFTGYCRLTRNPDTAGERRYYADDVLAARTGGGPNEASEDKADLLYLDLRRAGDLIRYKDGFALASIEPVDGFTDAVCWFGIDRDADRERAKAIRGFLAYLLEPEQQQGLHALGLMSVRSDVKNVPPDAMLKSVFRAYERVQTVDPFLWHTDYDALKADAALARNGDTQAHVRFTNRLHELYR